MLQQFIHVYYQQQKVSQAVSVLISTFTSAYTSAFFEAQSNSKSLQPIHRA